MSRNYVLHAPRALTAAVAAALGLTVPSILVAQGAPGPAAANSEGEVQEVTVTGSRIVRRDYTALSPIVTVEQERLERSSTLGLESTLNQMPQFAPAGTQFVANQTESTAFQSVGIASLNMRGLGTNRNLVLINGRRAQPANATLVVDVNTIPSAAIANIEIISGGASSVYGADAIAGVVNFILKDNFEGLVLDAQTSATEEGDGEETRANALFGGKFSEERGSVMIGLDWTRRSEVLQADREFYRSGWADPGTAGGAIRGTTFRPNNPANQPSQAALDLVFDDFAPGSAARASQIFFNPDNTVFQSSPNAIGYDGPLDGTIKLLNPDALGRRVLSEVETQGLISSPMERYSAFGRATYAITDNINSSIQATFSSIEIDSVLVFSPAVTFWDATIPHDAAHPVPEELEILLNSRLNANGTSNAAGPWRLERYLDFLGPRKSTNTNNVYQVMLGLDGKIPAIDWTWEAYASQGRTDQVTYLKSGFASLNRYRQLVQSANYGRGFSANANNGFVASCTTGLPIFEDFTPSQDCIDAIQAQMKNYTDFTQEIVEANLQGKLFNLPSGELRTAIGASWRKNEVTFQPDPLLGVESFVDQPIGLFAVSDTAGSTTVKEVYAEFLVPLLNDLPLMKDLNLELGIRHSDYNTAGGELTWKALMDWSLTDTFTFRGGYQVASRAPNTAELFTGSTLVVSQFPLGDPCASNTQAPWGNTAANPDRAQVQELCRAIIDNPASNYSTGNNADTYVGPFGFFPLEIENRTGNPDLATEEAKTWTFGFVFNSPFDSGALRNFTISVDWYNIELAGAINPISAVTVYQLCLNGNGTSNPDYLLDDPGGVCRLITRDRATGDRLRVNAPYLNLGGIETSGIDLSLAWRSDFADMGLESVPGGLALNLSFNWLDTFKTQASPGAPFLENAGTLAESGQYDWRLSTNLTYNIGSVNVGINWRHLPSAHDAAFVTVPTTTIDDVDSYDNFSLSAGWRINDTLQIRGGVDNLFNADPNIVAANPPVTNNATNTLPGYYDLLGRRYYLGVKATF
jgi:iron complex outermembrane recepter protein